MRLSRANQEEINDHSEDNPALSNYFDLTQLV